VNKAKRIILGVTGSIAAYKAADILRLLMDQGFRVSVVMTREAENFIPALTLSSLAGEPVYKDMFSKDQDAWKMPHISLAREADCLLIAPATANIIAKLSCGLADDLLTCIALGTKAKILIAPAMNTEMYKNPILQEHCQKLKKLGAKFIDPVEGKLACGIEGTGHIAEAGEIVKAVLAVLK
jgi:phosphopantothenoylcysteine decarboxylase/phosphopantothenate--cysteine ligase